MKTILALALVLFSVQAKADGSVADFAKEASTTLAKSGTFASCDLEGRDVEGAVVAISAAYAGKLSTSVTLYPYGSGSFKACLVLQAK